LIAGLAITFAISALVRMRERKHISRLEESLPDPAAIAGPRNSAS
jgi:hypothetical protein